MNRLGQPHCRGTGPPVTLDFFRVFRPVCSGFDTWNAPTTILPYGVLTRPAHRSLPGRSESAVGRIGELCGFVTAAAAGNLPFTVSSMAASGPGFALRVRGSAWRNYVGLVAGAGGNRVVCWLGELAGCTSGLQHIAEGSELPLAGLNRSFVLAAWDRRDRSLLLCGDRYGNQPLYYGMSGSTLHFSTRASAVAMSLGGKTPLDRETLAELVWFGHPVSTRTLFAGVRRLPPATRLRWRNGRVVLEPYWQPVFRAARPGQTLVADVCAAFGQAVARDTDGERVALALTGGQDTRALLAAALTLERPVFGFCAGVKGSLDLVVARRLGRRLRGRFRGFTLGPGFLAGYPALAENLVLLAEGALGLEHAHNLALHHYCRERFAALIDGGGARVSKRGFLRRVALGRHANSDAADLIVERYGRPGVARLLFPAPAARELEMTIRERIARLVRDSEQDDLGGTLDACFLRANWANFYARAAALQSHFVEGRLPYLDHEFVDLVLRLPRTLRERSVVQHAVVARLGPELRRHGRVFCDVLMPWTDNALVRYAFAGMGRAAELTGLSLRLARPCFPFRDWWRQGLARLAAERLDALAERGLFDADRVTALARRCRAGNAGIIPAAELLWRLEIWHELFAGH